jgi:hypothetical protein
MVPGQGTVSTLIRCTLALFVVGNVVALTRISQRSTAARVERVSPLGAVQAAGRAAGHTFPDDVPSVILTVDPRSSTDAASVIEEVRGAGGDGKLVTFLIVPMSERAAIRLPSASWIVPVSTDQLGDVWLEHFGVWDQWYAFNGRGTPTMSGGLFTGGLISAVRRALGEFDTVDRRMREVARRLVDDSQHSGRTLEHVLFVRRANTNCPSGDVIAAFAIASRGARRGEFVTMVPTTWSGDDIQALRATFALDTPVKRVSRAADREWANVEHEVGQDVGSVFLGTIRNRQLERLYTSSASILRTLKAGL